MLIPKILLGFAATSLVATTSIAHADTHSSKQDTATKSAVSSMTTSQQSKIIQTSEETFAALREVQSARLAIFNAKPKIAVKIIVSARDHLQNAMKDAKNIAVKTGKSKSDLYVPFDVSMSLAEGYKEMKNKSEKIKKANKYIEKGKEKKAIEVLKLANVDVTITAALIPIKAANNHVSDALKLLKEKKYYEANLALKALSDSVIVESYGVDEIPVQGK